MIKDHSFQYEWMSKKLKEKIGDSSKFDFPIWAWHTLYGKSIDPDITKELLDIYSHNNENKDLYLLKLFVPEHLVLLSDFDAWHSPLNKYAIIDSNDDDLNAFDLMGLPEHIREKIRDDKSIDYMSDYIDEKTYEFYLGKKSIDKDLSFVLNPYFVSLKNQLVVSTWDTIFDINNIPSGYYDKNRNIQAVFPYIEKGWVINCQPLIKIKNHHIE